MSRSFLILVLALNWLVLNGQQGIPVVMHPDFKPYPEVADRMPNLPSPFQNAAGEEFVIAKTRDAKYAVIRVSLSNDRGICRQLVVDARDFPKLAKTGLHDAAALKKTSQITGWSVDTITLLGMPRNLSYDGFLAEDEHIISVLSGDNKIVEKLGLTHPQMAKPLFHVLNMMDTDLELKLWNMPIHQWDHIRSFQYHGNTVHVIAYDTKGGQKSIFNDSLQGAFHIKLWHEFTPEETAFIDNHYSWLSQGEKEILLERLGFFNTGELEPQYIMRYGFYEGHTGWRADPIAIAFIFGFKTLGELHQIFDGNLFGILTRHSTTQSSRSL